MLDTSETFLSNCDEDQNSADSSMESGYISYVRVSTDKQGESGLGLEAQRHAIERHINGTLLAEFLEVESGKNHKNRPQLLAALAECKRRKAKLVIAKLDRLARNVAFIANLMNSGVEFIAVDFPQANKLTIHILAAVAEHEREMISQRTKAALAAKKARGCKLGNPRWQESIGKATEAKRVAPPTELVLSRILTMHHAGRPLRAIAKDLNDNNIQTSRSKPWHHETIRRLIEQHAPIK